MTVLPPQPGQPPQPGGSGALWPFASALYAAPGVSQCAIMLQDQHAVDVNIMLFACWAAGFEDGLMTGQNLARAMAVARPLQDTVRPLRAQRRAIAKGGPREDKRQALLREELAAEQAELEALEAQWPAPGAPLNDRMLIEERAAANLQLYIGMCAAVPAFDAMMGLALVARAAADIHLERR